MRGKKIFRRTAMQLLVWLGVILLVLLYTMQSLFTKLYTDRYPGREDMASSILTVVSGVTVAVVTFVCFEFCNFTLNGWCILIGALNAVALYGYNYFIVKASQSGPYSILMMFNLAGGIIIPIVASLIMGWDEAWNSPFRIALNVVCITAIISAVYLVSNRPEPADEKKGISFGFILSCLGLSVCNGVYGIFLTLQQQTEAAGGEGNRGEMIITTFVCAALISFVIGLVKEKGKLFFASFKQTKGSALFLALTSIVFALAINLIVIIIPHFDTTILYTIDNSSVLIMSVLISWIFFKERLTRMNVVGIVIMCSALVSMNLLPAVINL